MRERLSEGQVRAHLVKRVREIGGEIRKVGWVGRNNAPDELVMLPERFRDLATLGPLMQLCIQAGTAPATTAAHSTFVELKAEGLAATFPNDAHERAQWREHERMRGFGLKVVVIDSIEGVEELLR